MRPPGEGLYRRRPNRLASAMVPAPPSGAPSALSGGSATPIVPGARARARRRAPLGRVGRAADAPVLKIGRNPRGQPRSARNTAFFCAFYASSHQLCSSVRGLPVPFCPVLKNGTGLGDGARMDPGRRVVRPPPVPRAQRRTGIGGRNASAHRLASYRARDSAYFDAPRGTSKEHRESRVCDSRRVVPTVSRYGSRARCPRAIRPMRPYLHPFDLGTSVPCAREGSALAACPLST